MRAWSRLGKEFPQRTVLFAVQTGETAARACAGRSASVRVLRDPGGEAARRYNARWPVRAFAIDEQGLLTYVQPESTPDARAPLEVEEHWKSGGIASPGRNPVGRVAEND